MSFLGECVKEEARPCMQMTQAGFLHEKRDGMEGEIERALLFALR